MELEMILKFLYLRASIFLPFCFLFFCGGIARCSLRPRVWVSDSAIGTDFDRGVSERRSSYREWRKKSRLVSQWWERNTAWAVIEGQGERVTENERGGGRVRACVRRVCLAAVHGRSPSALHVAFAFFFLSFLLRQRKETSFASQYKYWPFRGNPGGID